MCNYGGTALSGRVGSVKNLSQICSVHCWLSSLCYCFMFQTWPYCRRLIKHSQGVPKLSFLYLPSQWSTLEPWFKTILWLIFSVINDFWAPNIKSQTKVYVGSNHALVMLWPLSYNLDDPLVPISNILTIILLLTWQKNIKNYFTSRNSMQHCINWSRLVSEWNCSNMMSQSWCGEKS